MRSYNSDSKQLSKEIALNYFKETWNGKIPVFKTFENNSGRYLYDTGTGKILECDAINYKFLELVQSSGVNNSLTELICNFGREETLKSVQELTSAMDREKVLLGFKEDFLFSSQHFSGLRNLMDTEMGHIVLEVTEGCNLRCAYCIHNDTFDKVRNHGSKGMEIDIASEQ